MSGFHPQKVFISACFGMLIYGIVMTVLGSILPSVILKFDLDKADAGSLFVMLSFGIVGGSLVFGPLVDRFGYKPLLTASAGLIILTFQGIAHAPSVYLLYAAIFCTGFAGGAINGGTNALVSDISEGRRGSRLTYLGVFFGIGAFGVPLLLGSLLDRFSYEAIISTVGAMIVLPLLLFLVLQFPRPKHNRGFPLTESAGLFRQRPLILFGFVLFFQGGLEMSMGGWSATYFLEVHEVASRYSVLLLSLFWFGLTLARFFQGRILLSMSGSTVLDISFALSLAGSLVLLLSGHTGIAVAGLFVVGIGFAAIFPVILSFVGEMYARLSGTAFSIVFVIALGGGMSVPWLIGILADRIGLQTAMMIIPFCVAGGFIVYRVAMRYQNRSEVVSAGETA
ncbi:MFS transporter [Natronogracilivirga saccharolytica]|uniref:MFS transporter n=1 Tax=Natronogracilivirga saccharolytica TaxID=2812953 RepID=A0A8J7UUZ5_9BACT|nr:MFS transporter [Natronogracilivirga saccharolytica]MBP3192890.1 MFS transporter [Natronogracilivirga saccharolytica]